IYSIDNFPLREAEIVDQQLRAVCLADMVETLEVCLPVTHVLIVDSVDDMLAQNQKGLEGVGLPGKQVRRNQVGLMYRGALIATTDGGQNLLAKPREICFQVRKQGWRRENPRERFVTVQQMLRISF